MVTLYSEVLSINIELTANNTLIVLISSEELMYYQGTWTNNKQ